MGLFSWDPTPAKNAGADPLITAQDGASARSVGATIRGFMSGMRRFTDDVGGALTTSGRLNAYVVTTHSGIPELRAGLTLLVRADRDNTAEATLNVDGLGPLPWVDAGGVPLPAGRILKGRYYSVFLDPDAPAWRIQAGASTLDEIPGLIDLRSTFAAQAAEVAADAADIAQDRAAVEADRIVIGSDKASAEAARTAAQLARAGAEAARDVVQGAVDIANGLDSRIDEVEGAPSLGIGALRPGGDPAYSIQYDAVGALVAASDGDGSLERQAGGAWSGLGAEPSLGVGVANGAPYAAPTEALQYDASGVVVEAEGGDGLPLLRDGYGGFQQVATHGAFGLGVGALTPGGLPAVSLSYDADRVAAEAVDGQGRTLLRQETGAWVTAETAPTPVLGYGALGPDAASVIEEVSLDDEGRIVSARCQGGRDYAVDYVATANGFLRRETPRLAGSLIGAGTQIALPEARLFNGGDDVTVIAPQAYGSPNPATRAFTTTLSFDEAGRQRTLPGCPLVGPVTVTEGATTYTLNTDYQIDPNRGVIIGLAGLAGKTVDVVGTSALQRIDLVCYDQETRAVATLQGEELAVEPALGTPKPGAGQVPLFRVYRTLDVCEAHPLYLFDGILRRDMRAEILAEIERSRRHLAPLVARARRGETLRIAWTGDSIHQMGEPNSPDWLAVNPNGRDRDSMFYFDRYTAEMQKLIRQYLKEDGQGTRLHVEESVAWAGVHRLRELGAQCITGNFAIGGTYSSADVVNGRKNILHPDRMAAVIAWQPDLFILATGMNERGENFTGPNITKILTPFLTNNIPCVVITPPLVNPYYDDGANIGIFKTCAIELQVARTLGCASVYTPYVLGDATRQISLREVGMQWGLHPAFPELEPMKRLHRMLYN